MRFAPVLMLAVAAALGLTASTAGQGSDPRGSLGPRDFEASYARAEAMRAAGAAEPAALRAAYARAVTAFDALGADDPARAANLGRAAHSALLAGAPERALALGADAELHDAVDDLPVEVRLRALAELGRADAFVVGLRAASTKHADAVARACTSVVAGHAGALCEAADRALRRGRHDDGLFVFEAFAKATGRAPVALGNWALSLRHVGRTADSERLYREALAASPNDPDLWNDYGLLLKGQRRDPEAMAAFGKSFALDTGVPPTGPAVSNLAFMQAHGRAGTDAPVLEDPCRTLAAVVARRADAMLARRLLLDALATPARFQVPRPDTSGAGR